MKAQPTQVPVDVVLSGKALRAVLVSLALAAAVAATLLVTSRASEDSAPVAASGVGPGTSVERDAAIVASHLQGGSTAPERSRTGAGSGALSIYLVESEAQAASATRALEEASLVSAHENGAALAYEVVIVTSDAEAEAFVNSKEVVPGLHSGVPSFEIVDLR